MFYSISNLKGDSMKAFAIILTAWLTLISVTNAASQVCEQLEKKGELLYQKFNASKSFQKSSISNEWTDCILKADGTTIMIAGIIGTKIENRIQGITGSGFHILSIDRSVTIRTIYSQEHGLIIRVDSNDLLKKTGCLYNTAYITLDGMVTQNP